MDLRKSKIDPERLEKGGWVGNIPDCGKLRVRVRGLGNTDDLRIQAEEIEKLPREKKVRGVPGDERDRILGIRLRDAILQEWEHLNDDGVPVPYSPEMAAELLSNPEYRAFRDAVVWAASIVAIDRAEDLKVDAKN
jgi:hypothetical protein